MSKTLLQQDLLRLPPEERLEIADALYSSLDPGPLSDRQKTMLDERSLEADAHPERFSAWGDAKNRIDAKIRRSSNHR